ncbi:uncharacterized protein BX663DRAFT_501785 [Cokeromyces recurvatus]|uniref:uncharacterized protein n=1 Tax=Cokeromyces recurvatus TaxID=90255 RepID=UPI00221FE0B3|nr:uncharacterized protein BX663DRAFT_501785 [Cokeromyces recurvatus]KAI7905110.1 hypothetical protein BX663DRAFT_501785 [Cokeromyces recurvatus]
MRELNEDQQHSSNNVSRWKRLRCSSFLARSPPSSNTTTHGLSSFCSQAANKIMPSWHRNHRPSAMTIPCSPQSSISTPASNLTTASRSIRQRKGGEGGLKKCKSSLCIVSENNPELSLSSHISIADTTTTTTSSISHELKSTIKIKVIYDAHNIIVIQVPRTIALHDLRSRIAQKFSDPSIGSPIKVHHEDLVLLFNENGSYSSSSTSSSTHNSDIVTLPAILINKEKDLINMMQTKWNRMNKVTLRCII